MNRQPAWVVGVLMGLFFGVGTFVVNVSIGIQRLSWASAVAAAIGGVLFGAVMALLVARQRRKSGGTSMAQSVTNAVKRGELPHGASADEWMPLLERRRRQAKLLRWLGPLEFGLFAALAVYLIVTDGSRVIFWDAALVFFLALAVWYPINSRRQLRSIEQLERQLAEDARSAGPAPIGGS
ncbi:hypothetical protein ACRAWB_15075 [Leifsonia poae]|uniref:hypothetical protein n=1 Tax=Leifsonia poae TaxID=110933 RepID=UPI003D6975E7